MNDPIFSPSNIEALLHFYSRPEPHPRQDAPAIQEAIKWFLEIGAIKKELEDDFYRTTAMGNAWVKSLCNVKPPREAFVDEAGNVYMGLSSFKSTSDVS